LAMATSWRTWSRASGMGGFLRLVLSSVMPALVAGIHVSLSVRQEKDVDGRAKPGHDDVG
jgi:hypothetical protein